MDKRTKFQASFYVFIFIVNTVFISGCSMEHFSNKDLQSYIQPSEITIKSDHFVDNFGRQVLLNGINVVSKSREEDYIFPEGPDFYSNLKKWGFNCIRFIIIWDGLEPKPGIYNQKYLRKIDQCIKWASENNIFVVLDMHQDLFSVKYNGDGAPWWACLDNGNQNTVGKGATWDDAYFTSPAIQSAFDNFWMNKKAPDGIGIQDHYANLWQYIAKRYASNTNVLGYDIMNEPFPGSVALKYMSALLSAYAQLIYASSGKELSPEELMSIWTNAQKRKDVFKILSNKKNYAFVIDTLNSLNCRFDSTKLQPMYQKVANAIREADTNHILFMEHNYFSNLGVKSCIQRTHLPDGAPDILVAYAPHAYDLVTDTKDAAQSAPERIDFIYKRIAEKGKELNMPVWLGEWGAYYRNPNMVPVARHAISQIEKYLFSNAYWSYDPGTENMDYFQKALLRPYPAYISGMLLQYKFNYDNHTLFLQWHENMNIVAPTCIYVPWISRLENKTEYQNLKIRIKKIKDSNAGWIIIPSMKKDTVREIILRFKGE